MPVYESLSPGRTIRLLELLDDVDGKISCRLTAQNMSQCTPYIALSYTWGEARHDREILLNDQRVMIRENLWNFLQQAKSNGYGKSLDNGAGFLWIDALCIDQSHNNERTHQVNLMADIYKQARSTIIWLGASHSGSDQAMDGLRNLDKAKFGHTSRTEEGTTISISVLCMRDYWTRLWVLQEVMLSRNIILMCGNKTAPWRPFKQLLDDSKNDRNSPPHKIIQISPALVMLSRIDAHDRSNLFNLILSTTDLKCAEKRDRIFALLGVATTEEEIVPDREIPMPALLNLVLRNHHSSEQPRDLSTILQQCRRLDAACRCNETESSLQLTGATYRPLRPSDFEAARKHSLVPHNNGLSLWWAHCHGHSIVAKMIMNEAVRTTWLKAASADASLPTLKIVLHNVSGVQVPKEELNDALGLATDPAVVQLLLEEGANADAASHHEVSDDASTATVLQHAIYKGHTRIVRLLLRYGASPNTYNANSRTPLVAAIWRDDRELVQLLLDHGAATNHKIASQQFRKGSALCAAIVSGHAELVRLLLTRGAKVNENLHSSGENTLLHIASRLGHLEIVELLLDQGLPVDTNVPARIIAQDVLKCRECVPDTQGLKDDVSALDVALVNGHADVANLLIVRGAKASTSSNGPNTESIFCAASKAGHVEAVKLMLSQSVATKQMIKKAVHSAAGSGRMNIVELLLPISKGRHGRAFANAAEYGHTNIMQLLLNRSLGLRPSQQWRRTALMSACEWGHIDAVEMLLAAGVSSMPIERVSLSKSCRLDTTPLYVASRYGHKHVVETLLRNGARVNQKTTLAHYCSKCRSWETVSSARTATWAASRIDVLKVLQAAGGVSKGDNYRCNLDDH